MIPFPQEKDGKKDLVFDDINNGWVCIFARRYASDIDEQNDFVSHLELLSLYNYHIKDFLKDPNTRDDAMLIRKLPRDYEVR